MRAAAGHRARPGDGRERFPGRRARCRSGAAHPHRDAGLHRSDRRGRRAARRAAAGVGVCRGTAPAAPPRHGQHCLAGHHRALRSRRDAGGGLGLCRSCDQPGGGLRRDRHRRALRGGPQCRGGCPVAGRHRHGQARWPGAQFLLGRRPDFSLSGDRRERRPGLARCRRLLPAHRPGGDTPARCGDRRRLCLPGRHAAAPVRRLRAAGSQLRGARGLPAEPRP